MASPARATRPRALAQERTSVYIALTKPRITLMVLLTVALGYVLAPASGDPWVLLHVVLCRLVLLGGWRAQPVHRT